MDIVLSKIDGPILQPFNDFAFLYIETAYCQDIMVGWSRWIHYCEELIAWSRVKYKVHINSQIVFSQSVKVDLTNARFRSVLSAIVPHSTANSRAKNL